MTTVINFNFLNFFKLRLDNRSVNINNDVRSYNQYFDNRSLNYSPEQEEVIDVTPYNFELAEKDNIPEFKLLDVQRTAQRPGALRNQAIYSRKGNTIQYLQEKGLLVNSYV
jgi:hypothetical protein